jgi:predicted MPP superfamily phosphohydrolase
MKLFKHKRLFIIILIALLLLFAAKAYYDTNSIEVRHYQIKNLFLGKVLGGLKVAHLSDLHLKSIGLRENKILEILKKEKPDLIFITGDLISFEGPYEPVMSFLSQLKPPLGIYAVLGNTEYSNENGSCILCHEERSKSLKRNQHPIFLRNSLSFLKVDGKTLNILGVDDPVGKKSNLKTALKDTDSKDPSILLAHSPEIIEEASGCGLDLLLCGHTHGGQIFLTRYLRKIFPLEASLEFIEGFFQKGKMLMYVSRGIGTSYLPFRFGVKPEITFFKFTNDTNEKIRMSRIDQPDEIGGISTVSISNFPPYTFFLGFSISSILETFDFVGVIRNSFASTNSSNSSVLFDFESEEEIKRLNWECHKWFELSEENATSGKYALKVTLPPGQYPGINFHEIRSNWSEFRYLKMDVFNPDNERINFHVRIDDNKSGVEYANRFHTNFELKRGINQISIPVDSIRTNIYHQPLNLKRIKRMIVFLMNNTKPRELYIDNIRLE